MQPSSKRRHKSGQSIIEAVVGLFVILMVIFALADLVVLIQAGNINGDLAARAARAAANQPDSASAIKVVDNVQSSFKTSNIISKVDILKLSWDTPASGQLTIDSTISVNLPFPIPFMNMNPLRLSTQSVTPILN